MKTNIFFFNFSSEKSQKFISEILKAPNICKTKLSPIERQYDYSKDVFLTNYCGFSTKARANQ